MASETERRPGSALSIPAHAETWNDRFRSLSIESPIVDERAFKVQLAIGEDAYATSRWFKRFADIADSGGAVFAGGSVAASSAVAGTFFSAGGFLGLLGLGTAATPVGWVLAAAGISGVAWYYGKRKLRSKLRSWFPTAPVEVVPVFINRPVDVLALGLFDLMMPLALKIAKADGQISDDERSRIKEYFTKTWGYDPSLVALGIDWVEEGLPAFQIEDVAKALAVFARDEPDCNHSVMTGKIVTFLQELIEADGRIHPNEERELARVRELLERIE